jgi:hypothetical protein
VSRLLPKFHRRQLEREDAAQVDRVVAEAAEPVAILPGHHVDRHALRGVPVVGVGIPGCRRDEHPERALLHKERVGRPR